MKIIRFDDVVQVPASHEDARDPGVLKKVLFREQDLFVGRIQMINWATLLAGKTCIDHYHQDMQEVFLMMGSGAVVKVDGKEISLNRGDALVVDAKEAHEMKNPTNKSIEYIVLGIA